MQELITIIWEIVVDDNIDTLDIDTSSKKIGSNQDTSIEILKRLVLGDTFFLLHSSVNTNGREITLSQQSVQLLGARHLAHKDDNLIEFQDIKQVIQLSVLFSFSKLAVVKGQTVKGQLCLIVDVNFHGILAELFADRSDLLGQGRREEHDLLFMRRKSEDLLNIPTHVERLKDTITLIEHKVLDSVQLKVLITGQGKDTSRSSHNDVRCVILENLSVSLNIDSSVKDSSLD